MASFDQWCASLRAEETGAQAAQQQQEEQKEEQKEEPVSAGFGTSAPTEGAASGAQQRRAPMQPFSRQAGAPTEVFFIDDEGASGTRGRHGHKEAAERVQEHRVLGPTLRTSSAQQAEEAAKRQREQEVADRRLAAELEARLSSKPEDC